MNRPIDPTPEQIAEACREIRSRWTEAERIKRLARPEDRPAQPMQVPTVSVEDFRHAITT